jgi:hypothetical protein
MRLKTQPHKGKTYVQIAVPIFGMVENGGDPGSTPGGSMIVFCDIEGIRMCSQKSRLFITLKGLNRQMKIDPYNHKERYLSWKKEVAKKGIQEISKINSKVVLAYLTDMENGLNVANDSKKGSRSPIRLASIKQRMIFLCKQFEKFYNVRDITKITEREIHLYFSDMRNGTIKRFDGKPYRSSVDYVKSFKAFWHWHMKLCRKIGKDVGDITIDLDTSRVKPEWVYLDESQIKELWESAKYEYRVLIMFLFDTGIRAPTELINIKVSDLVNDCRELIISDEVSKTFGRRIKLMLCSDMIKGYIKTNGLSGDDFLFKINPPAVNQYFKRLSKRVFGDNKSLAGQKYSELTMYDFRHCSCCYWLPRYKSESALKFRFGWKKSDKIHYYSEMLGMRDTISEEDLLVDVTKTEIEQRLLKTENEKKILEDRMKVLENQMKDILNGLNQEISIGEKHLKIG